MHPGPSKKTKALSYQCRRLRLYPPLSKCLECKANGFFPVLPYCSIIFFHSQKNSIMDYSPHLKNVMEDIKSLLQKNDIAASIALHTPGHGEFLLHLSPTYSCAFFEGDILRIKAKLQEDFQGDKKAWTKKITDTANMLHHLAMLTANMSVNLIEASETVDKAAKTEHSGKGFTSHTF